MLVYLKKGCLKDKNGNKLENLDYQMKIAMSCHTLKASESKNKKSLEFYEFVKSRQ